MKSKIRYLISEIILTGLIAVVMSLFIPNHTYSQTTCPSLQPVITGTDPTRSQNAWQTGAPVVVNILNKSMSGNGAYVFSDSEV